MSTTKRCKKTQTPGEQARLSAGFDLKQASRKLGLCPRYLRHIELHGNAPLKTARRLATLYNCSGNIFLHTPKFLSELNQKATRRSNPSPQHPMANRDSNRVSAAASSNASDNGRLRSSTLCFHPDGVSSREKSEFQ